MNILLVNPPCRVGINENEEFAFVRAGSRWPFSTRKKKDERLSYVPFPFFMSYAAALLKKNGFSISVIDAVPLNLTEEEFISEACKRSPDLVMIETSTPTVQSDIDIAQKLKSKSQAKIALAGPHVSVMPKQILEQVNHIDFVLIGEYELTLLNLAMSIKNGASLGSIAGLAFRNGSQVLVNNAKSIIEPLDLLPFPARHLFPIDTCEDQDVYWDGFCQYKPAIQINSSRGCPFSCSFCLWTQTMYPPHKVRTFSAKRVVDEMEYLIGKYGAKEIYFDDDTFTARKEHVTSICKELKDRDVAVYWSCMGDAMITDETMIETMADAGCIGMKFGVESGNPEILKRVGKPVNLEKVKKVAGWCAERGVKTHATFTFGLPGENRETMEQTLEYAKSLDVDSVQFSITTPFPGTRYFDELERNGLLLTKDWRKFDGNCGTVVRYENLSTEEVEDFYICASGRWLRYKLKSPKWVVRQAYNLWRLMEGQGISALGGRIKRAMELL